MAAEHSARPNDVVVVVVDDEHGEEWDVIIDRITVMSATSQATCDANWSKSICITKKKRSEKRGLSTASAAAASKDGKTVKSQHIRNALARIQLFYTFVFCHTDTEATCTDIQKLRTSLFGRPLESSTCNFGAAAEVTTTTTTTSTIFLMIIYPQKLLLFQHFVASA